MTNLTGTAVLVFLMTGLISCASGPSPIKMGKDTCNYCKMTISDGRFGGEIITNKGKIYKFDDIKCLLSFSRDNDFNRAGVKDIYLSDFTGSHLLLKANDTKLLKSEELKAPMGGMIAAFNNADTLKIFMEEYHGNILTWQEVYQP